MLGRLRGTPYAAIDVRCRDRDAHKGDKDARDALCMVMLLALGCSCGVGPGRGRGVR